MSRGRDCRLSAVNRSTTILATIIVATNIPLAHRRCPVKTSLGKDFPPERVRAIRLALGMTLKEAGARAGVSMNIWSRWEREADKPSASRPNTSACMILEKMEGEAKYKDLVKWRTELSGK